MRHLQAAPSLVLPLGLAVGACAGLTPSAPYVQIDDRYQPAAALNVAPAEILGVDGEMFLRQRPLTLEPGPHAILVESRKTGVGRRGPKPASMTLYLKTEPCTLYAIAAVHACAICAEWAPQVVHHEPIPGCIATSQPTAPAG